MMSTEPPPLPLKEWIQRTKAYFSEEEYNECAVSVALELSNRLCRLVGANTTSFDNDFGASSMPDTNFDFLAPSEDEDKCNNELFHPRLPALDTNFDFLAPSGDEKKYNNELLRPPLPSPICLQDIVPENILVFVSSPVTLTASDVIIQSSKLKAPSTPTNISSREACFALGKILFEVFSRGDPLLPNHPVSSPCDENQDPLFSDLLLESLDLDVGDMAPPASKKPSPSTTENMSSTTFTRAKIHLQERGLPLAPCQLVSDLLEAEEGNEFASDTALMSLEDARFDLARMKALPLRFLHGQTCPKQALENTFLFNPNDGELYGRAEEKRLLMDAAWRVPCGDFSAVSELEGTDGFFCEAVFVSGQSGSGKSSILKELVSFCNAGDWSILHCKFDRQVAPLSIFLQSIDGFFAQFWREDLGGRIKIAPQWQDTFDRISRSIIYRIDAESFGQLCILLPHFGKLFPRSYTEQRSMHNGPRLQQDGSIAIAGDQTRGDSTQSTPGSGRNRLHYLFRIIFKSLCTCGHPVALILDDLQWCDSATIDIIDDYIHSAGYGESLQGQGKLLYVGSFRENEVEERGFLMSHIDRIEQSPGNINLTEIVVGALSEHDINEMLSFKLCLPKRHTRPLSEIIFRKTQGMAIFVVEFLRSIIHECLTFSVKEKRWVWDETSIDMKVMPEGVVSLLTRKLGQLPQHIVQALKIVSCFGFQIDLSTVQLLDLGQFVGDMVEALEGAVTEGILERAGPIFAFSHDMLQESTYNLIPSRERTQLHKTIALSLVNDPDVWQNAELCKIAADQIVRCKDMEGIHEVDKEMFAKLNLAAGKHSIRASSFEQAWRYFEVGISLLHARHWETQYPLSLELYEMVAVTSFMDGNIDSVSGRLNEILSNSKSFDDGLNARALLAQSLVAQGHAAKGAKCVLEILSGLGESFATSPSDITLSLVVNEIQTMLPKLRGITQETILGLPAMTNTQKRTAMKFMSLLISISVFSSPMFDHFLSCRMIKLSFEFGFCDDTISGLVSIAHGLILYFSEEIEVSKTIHKIAFTLIKGHTNEHALRARLTVPGSSVFCIVQPFQSTADTVLAGYTSGNIVGDKDGAVICAFLYCIGSLHLFAELPRIRSAIVAYLNEMANHKRLGVLYMTMSCFNACTALIGVSEVSSGTHPGIKMKMEKELWLIAEDTQNSFLTHNITTNGMFVHCYLRDYLHVVSLAEKYYMNHNEKRTMDFLPIFYQGISALCLAKDMKEEKWREIGERAITEMTKYQKYCTWNFENKLLLLQAQLFSLDGRHSMAELRYQAAIVSAHEHRFVHEEALACELYGIHFIESKRVDKGLEQLTMAMDRYKEWGSMKKHDNVKEFMELVALPAHLWKA